MSGEGMTAMTVETLREVLDGLPDDMPVILSKDAEGNGFSPLASAGPGRYEPTSTWSGECWPTLQQVLEDGESEWDGIPDDDELTAVLVLDPVN